MSEISTNPVQSLNNPPASYWSGKKNLEWKAVVPKVVRLIDRNLHPLVEASCVWDFASDISYLFRQTANFFGVDSYVFQIVGTPTALNSVTGVLAFNNAMVHRAECAKIGYASGHTDNTIAIVVF